MSRKGIPINSETLREIGAVIDIQGFFLPYSQSFHGRELAVVSISDGFKQVVNINPSIGNSLHWNDDKAINYVFDHIHGLPLKVAPNEAYIHNSWLKEALHTISNLFTTKDQRFLACKNHHVSMILHRFGIPFVNLEFGALVCPKSTELDHLYNTHWTCPKHNKVQGKTYTCALRKAVNIASWVRVSSLPILLSPSTLKYENVDADSTQHQPMDVE